jgi:hypothetical protein
VLQRVGTLRPKATVRISTNRYDPFAPWAVSRQLASDWRAMTTFVNRGLMPPRHLMHVIETQLLFLTHEFTVVRVAVFCRPRCGRLW